MHNVTCVYCKMKFDRDKEETVEVSNLRYAHKECAEKMENKKDQEEKDYRDLEEYIMKLFGEPYVNAKIRKQIRDFRKEYNYSFSGMQKALIWWFDIKGNSIEQANGGIGIIPFIYNDAYNYYYSLWLAEENNTTKNLESYQPVVEEIVIASPRVYNPPPRLFDLDETEE